MKNYIFIILGIALAFSSCRRKTGPDCCPPVEPVGSIEVHLNHLWGTDTIVRSTGKYVTSQGDTVMISEIKGLISNFNLQFMDNTFFSVDDYFYYKLSSSATNTLLLKGIPDEAYKNIGFFLGLDSTANHSDVTTYPRTSALSTYQAGGEMHWNWADGFIFTNITGNYRPANASRYKGFSFHLGMDPNLVKLSLAVSSFTIAGNSRLVELNLDWKEMFESPHRINIASQDVTHSTSGDTLAAKLSANMFNMAKVGSIK